MTADTLLSESADGLQAPFVLKDNGTYHMFYGDGNRICLARSGDGKRFTRIANQQGEPALFSGPMDNTRAPMVVKRKGICSCYYCAHE